MAITGTTRVDNCMVRGDNWQITYATRYARGLHTRPFEVPLSACNTDKLGVAWGRDYMYTLLKSIFKTAIFIIGAVPVSESHIE